MAYVKLIAHLLGGVYFLQEDLDNYVKLLVD